MGDIGGAPDFVSVAVVLVLGFSPVRWHLVGHDKVVSSRSSQRGDGDREEAEALVVLCLVLQGVVKGTKAFYGGCCAVTSDGRVFFGGHLGSCYVWFKEWLQVEEVVLI